jgi:hypothetical protein
MTMQQQLDMVRKHVVTMQTTADDEQTPVACVSHHRILQPNNSSNPTFPPTLHFLQPYISFPTFPPLHLRLLGFVASVIFIVVFVPFFWLFVWWWLVSLFVCLLCLRMVASMVLTSWSTDVAVVAAALLRLLGAGPCLVTILCNELFCEPFCSYIEAIRSSIEADDVDARTQALRELAINLRSRTMCV